MKPRARGCETIAAVPRDVRKGSSDMGAIRGSLLLKLLIVFASVSLTMGCRPEKAQEKQLTPVRVGTVQTYDATNAVRYSATLSPYTQVNLSFKSGGYVQSILQVKGADGRMRDVYPGDWVTAGTLLATVRQTDYLNSLNQAKAQQAQAQANFELAKQNYDRATSLYSSQSMTKPDYDSAKASFEGATASVNTAKAQEAQAEIALADCEVKTPVTGWVQAQNVAVGDLVGQSTVGFSIVDTHLVRAVFGVPDTMMGRVRLGNTQTITMGAIPGEFQGRITAISPSADPKSRVFSVEVTIPNPRNELKVGMIATVTVAAGTLPRPVLVVPLSAVVRSTENPNGFAVYVVDERDGQSFAHIRNVEVGETHGNAIGVTQGVTRGERVIVNGATTVQDGEQVQIIP